MPPSLRRAAPSAGEWWQIADLVQHISDRLAGSALADWHDTLRVLVRACLNEAGAACVHEVGDDGPEAA